MFGGQLNAVDDDISPDLWHKRLAHMSEKGLQLLAKQSLIPIAKDKSSNPCDYFLFGKQQRVSFQKNSTRKLEKLELVYSCRAPEHDPTSEPDPGTRTVSKPFVKTHFI